MNKAREWQFDGLVGPTHNYAGLALGNLAAQNNAGAASNPRLAALQGLEKMRFVRDLGVPQAFVPPHYRPIISELERLGFRGTIGEILQKTANYSPALVASVFSSSFMWTANAATITPSCDSKDGKLHITPANMSSHYHRAIESEFTYKLLERIFHNKQKFSVHNYFFHQDILGDEGAANHMLACLNHGLQGMHFFVYGESHKQAIKPKKFPARQKLFASESVVRLHKINQDSCMYLQQSPEVIDAGVFHHDVIGMNTTRRMIVHEQSFTPEDQKRFREMMGSIEGMRYREIASRELSVANAVSTYLFNSQLLDLGDDRFALVAPSEAQDNDASRRVVQALINEGVLTEVHYKNLRESMRNGGGPACLRLRVVMTEDEAAAIHPGVILTDAKYNALKQWIENHYRDRLTAEDFRDPTFVDELNEAYMALEKVVDMPGLYSDIIHSQTC
jgi:succinylarginine dihydrolase